MPVVEQGGFIAAIDGRQEPTHAHTRKREAEAEREREIEREGERESERGEDPNLCRSCLQMHAWSILPHLPVATRAGSYKQLTLAGSAGKATDSLSREPGWDSILSRAIERGCRY